MSPQHPLARGPYYPVPPTWWKWLSYLVVTSWLLAAIPAAQGQVPVGLTARVDTTQANTKAVYELLINYLNAKPDSLYANPYWQAAEVDVQVRQRHERVDLAAPFLFFDMSAKRTLATYQPTVLSIEPSGAKYVARLLLYAETPPKWVKDSHWNPPFLLRYYAARDEAGKWKLENAWANILANWSVYRTPWITFHYPPSFAFTPAKADQASSFCDSVVTVLHLTATKPFDYYVMNSEEELGHLFNFDYWLAYNTGFTQKVYNRTLSGRGREQHLHEFVHMLYHPVANYFLAEGIATYLGGVDGYTPYQETLRQVAVDLVRHPKITFEDLYTNKFKYPTNSNPRYAAGALVYALVYAKAGLVGFPQLEASENTYESFLAHVATLLQLQPAQTEAYLTQAVRRYAAQRPTSKKQVK
jgi:hypothetical protein